MLGQPCCGEGRVYFHLGCSKTLSLCYLFIYLFEREKEALICYPTQSRIHCLIFLKDFTNLFLERGEGRQKAKKHQCVVASRTPPTGDPAHNPDMCPDWELNRRSLVGRQALNPLSHTSQGSLVDSYMCPDQGSNPQPRCIRTTLSPTELPGQGLFNFFSK